MAGRWATIPEAVTRSIADIGVVAYAVYGVLAMHTDSNGMCWPSIDTIARIVGRSRRTVQAALRSLEAADHIAVEYRTGRAARYSLGGAVSCTPRDIRGATGCTGGAQPVAPGGAASCTGGAQPVAPRTRTKEQEPRTRTKELKGGRKKSTKESLPTELDRPDFRAAWEAWEQHRREIRRTLTASTRTRQLKMLQAAGVDIAIKIIDRSIEQGWTGLFALKESTNGKCHHTTGPGQRHPADRRDQVGQF